MPKSTQLTEAPATFQPLLLTDGLKLIESFGPLIYAAVALNEPLDCVV